MRYVGADAVSLKARLGVCAKLTVEESAHGPVFHAYREGSRSAVEGARIDSGRTGALSVSAAEPASSDKKGYAQIDVRGVRR
jgi:hypothetical protein